MKAQEIHSILLEALAAWRASNTPIRQLLSKNMALKKLYAKDRRRVRDLIFGYMRNQIWLEDLVKESLSARQNARLSRRKRDLLELRTLVTKPGFEEHQELLDGVPSVADYNPSQAAWPKWMRRHLSSKLGPESRVASSKFFEEGPAFFASNDPQHACNFMGGHVSPVDICTSALRAEKRLRKEVLEQVNKGHQTQNGRALDVWPMDLGSQIIVSALRVEQGHRVLDMCAGGGGKSRLIAHQSPRELVCLDINEHRLRACPKGKGIRHVVADALEFRDTGFDRILVDAPCTGSGTLRRQPDIHLRLREDSVPHYTALQSKLIQHAKSLLAPGGRLVYATCSVLSAENEHDSLPEGRLMTPDNDDSDGFYYSVIN